MAGQTVCTAEAATCVPRHRLSVASAGAEDQANLHLNISGCARRHGRAERAGRERGGQQGRDEHHDRGEVQGVGPNTAGPPFPTEGR